jgi:hypothetical protein
MQLRISPQALAQFFFVGVGMPGGRCASSNCLNPIQYLVVGTAFLLALAANVCGAVRYVDAGSLAPTVPYTNWATAAVAIQDAVDAAVSGDEIMVTNGIYATGGRPVGSNLLTNRVALDKPLTLKSVNGPQFTVIQGWQVPGTTNGDTAIRCVYLGSHATVAGFTLTNGATRNVKGGNALDDSGGGVWCDSTRPVMTNCVVSGNAAESEGGGVYGGTLNNCVLSGNMNGGAWSSTLNHCVVTGNFGSFVGGVFQSVLADCLLATNSSVAGGAASYSVLSNCTLVGNSASSFGGGTYVSTLVRCSLTGNSCGEEGGGAWGSSLNNCVLSNNSARTGGGTAKSSLTNCTVIGNWATDTGGVWLDNIANCIVYYNTASNGVNNALAQFISYSCTTPLPMSGCGNITNEPDFVSLTSGDFHLQSNSPCINSGNNACVTSSTDLDGHPRIAGGTVDMGAHEFQTPASVISYAWLQYFGLATDGSADYADPDGDGFNNWQEWVAGTDPTSSLSALRMLDSLVTASGVTLIWQSVTNRSYFIEWSTNLAAHPPFAILATNISGQLDTTAYTDTKLSGCGAVLYRVGVQ